MKSLLSILFFATVAHVSHAQLFGENDVGIINDKDGYTLIRENPNVNATVVDTLFEKEYFQFVKSKTSDWYEVYKMWNVKGFVHKSRIKNLSSLSEKEQFILIDTTFNKEIVTYKKRTYPTPEKVGKHWHYHEEKFIPILDLFIEYMCKSYNEKLMRKFFDLMLVESGSADETSPTALGYIYQCKPSFVKKLIKEYNKEVITNNLEFGKANIGIKD